MLECRRRNWRHENTGPGSEHLIPMNPTSRAIFQSVISSDPSLTKPERAVLERLLRGEIEVSAPGTGADDDRLLLSQKKAAKLLDVSRVTIWRMTKEKILHPVEIFPGTLRYRLSELAQLAQNNPPQGSLEMASARCPGPEPKGLKRQPGGRPRPSCPA